MRELHAGEARRAGRGEVRADLEEVRLRGGELRVDRRVGPRRAGDAEERVQLVDRAVGLDPRVGLRHARAAEERGLAGVAGARVDLHASDSSWRIRSLTSISAMSGITSQAMLRTTCSDISCTTRRAMRSICSSVRSPGDAGTTLSVSWELTGIGNPSSGILLTASGTAAVVIS